jgi:hypothetical protein
MSGGSHAYIYDHAGSLAELTPRTEVLADIAGRLLELGVDQAAADTRDLVRDMGQWEASAVRRASSLALVWRALDLHDSGDIAEEAVRAAGDVYTAGRTPPARHAEEDPVSYLREALDAHERSEHAHRALRLNSPEFILTNRENILTTEDGQEITEDWWNRHSDPDPDPFILTLITGMREVLAEYDRDARLLKTLDREGEAYGMTIRGQAVRVHVIRQWATAYAEREGA